MSQQKKKKCPFCAEKIQTQAIKCKHCGELLVMPEPDNSEEQKAAQMKKTINKHIILPIIIGLLALGLLFWVFWKMF